MRKTLEAIWADRIKGGGWSDKETFIKHFEQFALHSNSKEVKPEDRREKVRLAFREYLINNKEQVSADLDEMRKRSKTGNNPTVFEYFGLESKEQKEPGATASEIEKRINGIVDVAFRGMRVDPSHIEWLKNSIERMVDEYSERIEEVTDDVYFESGGVNIQLDSKDTVDKITQKEIEQLAVKFISDKAYRKDETAYNDIHEGFEWLLTHLNK